MRVVVGLLLLLLGLCGSGAQGEAGGLGEVAEINENTDPKDSADESTEQITKQTTCDIWTELRDTVVELNVQVELLQRENSDLQTRLSSSESELLISKSRIDQLETENADLQTRLNSSESELLISRFRIDQPETENAVQATELTSLGTRLTAAESKTRDLEKENADLQTRLSSSESRIDQLERANAEKPKVAFYTALTDDGRVGPYNTDTTLKFSKVFTNVGNAYNPSTGFFTAPVRGVYSLQFTVCGDSTGYMGIQVYKNNEKIMQIVESKHDEGSEYFTNSMVLELTAGDKIRLVLPSGWSIFDNFNNHNTFSGSLLFTL